MILQKFTCSIPDYPRDVQVSSKRRTNYWKQGEVIPKKYANYTYSNGFLVDPAGNKIIKNSKTAGTPRFVTINAQAIYVGMHHSVRSKIVNELHTMFHDEFKKQFPSQIVLGDNKILIALHFYDVYSDKLPDLDNLANLFVKCGVDCLTTLNNPNQFKGSSTHKLGILPDDKAIFIPHILYEFSNVDDPKDRKLDFNLYLVEKDFRIENLLDDTLKLNDIRRALKNQPARVYDDAE